MSVIKPGEARQAWRPQGAEPAVYLYLDADGDAVAQLAGTRVAGYELALIPVTASDWIDAAALAGAATAVVQVDADSQASMKRFERLVGATTTPLIAATYDPPLAFVRQLIRIGAHDVIPLPLEMPELETTLTAIRAHADQAQRGGGQATGKLVSIIKSVGGVGATALLTQLATRFAAAEDSHGREA